MAKFVVVAQPPKTDMTWIANMMGEGRTLVTL
jgi:hypothetical protein